MTGIEMPKSFLRLNVVAFNLIAAFVGSLVITAARSGHLQSLVCYECRACMTECPRGIDPTGFEIAARSYNADRYHILKGVELLVEEAFAVDQGMRVRAKFADGTLDSNKLTVSDVKKRIENKEKVIIEGKEYRYEDVKEVYSEEMRAKDVAQFCVRCGLCEKTCPASLRVLEIIDDLRVDGEFR